MLLVELKPIKLASCATCGSIKALSDVNQLAPPPEHPSLLAQVSSPSPGAKRRSSKLGSRPNSCLHSDGTRSRPSGHSCATAMASRRPRKRAQRSGCIQTLPGAPPSRSSGATLLETSMPGSGLSCTRPPGAGTKRPRRHLEMCPPACVRKARVTPPPPWPSSPSSPTYCTRSRPGRSSSGGAASTGPIAEARRRPLSTLSVDLWARLDDAIWPG
mmetsp:Transcript_84543/g.217797  ORF Transcript_84543/g.217797 Transcript_84543/m.217797 type:complete len:215 (+) Transcript_84543:1334-1978(+)